MRDAGKVSGSMPLEKRPTLLEVWYVVASIPAVVLLFVPFFKGTPPFIVCVYSPQAIIAVFILISSIRHAFYEPGLESGVPWAYGLSFVALAPTILMTFMMTRGGHGVIGPTVFVSSLGAVIVVVATRNGRVPARIHAHIAMLVAWMPNAAFWVALLWKERGKGTGYYLAVFTLVAYSTEIVLRVREAQRSYPEEDEYA